MPWLSRLAPVAGPLLPAARAFLDGHPGAPRPMGEGGDGLRQLADAIDDWAEREEVDAQDEERFVEGAGAVLALLLLAHVGEGAHVAKEGTHRVRLGRGGFFDPFAAIDRALEGPDARSVLAEEVRRAEAEAAGAAGVGRLMRLLEERLGSDRVARAFGPEVILDDGVELDLGRVLRATEDESEAAAVQAMDKLVSMLPGRGGAGLAWEEIEARLVPRLVAPGFVARLGAEGRGALAARALFGGALEVTLVLAYDDRARYLRDDELDAARCSLDDALALAARNLAARSEGARFARVDTGDGPIVVARSGDGLDGARLLLPTLHDVLSTELGSPFLAAVPHRDALWASADSPALAEALRARVAEDAARAPHAISAALFRVDASGVRPR